MITNTKKSGVMFVKSKDAPITDNILGYPITNHYKYLGATVTNNLSMESHLKNTRNKATYVTHRLTPIRLKGNTKLNLNLYKIFILPLYRLAFNNYGIGSEI